MKKRVKVKNKVYGFLILVLIIILSIFFLLQEKPKEKEIKKEPVISVKEQVLKKLSEEDPLFIDWIDTNYKDSMKNLLSLLETTPYQEDMWHKVTGYSYRVLNDLYEKKYDSMDNVKVLDANTNTISIVGDISLADNWKIMPRYDASGKGVYGILSEEVVDIMKKSDLMIANSEFTVSTRGTPMKGKQYTFRANPSRLSIYDEMGIDMVTLANNHVYDYGKDAFLDMLSSFEEKGLPHIGAGRNLEEAMKPYYFIIGGYKFAFVNATRAEKYVLTPGATENSEGVFRCYDPTNMINLIKSLRPDNDYVVAIIHFGWEDHHELEQVQIDSSHMYIDAGADIVVGHHAHTLQGVEFYNHKPIIYNLGDFIFSDNTDDTFIFQMTLKDDKTFDYKIIPGIHKNCYTTLHKDSEKQRVINNLNSWSINAHLTEEGQILEKNG